MSEAAWYQRGYSDCLHDQEQSFGLAATATARRLDGILDRLDGIEPHPHLRTVSAPGEPRSDRGTGAQKSAGHREGDASTIA